MNLHTHTQFMLMNKQLVTSMTYIMNTAYKQNKQQPRSSVTKNSNKMARTMTQHGPGGHSCFIQQEMLAHTHTYRSVDQFSDTFHPDIWTE